MRQKQRRLGDNRQAKCIFSRARLTEIGEKVWIVCGCLASTDFWEVFGRTGCRYCLNYGILVHKALKEMDAGSFPFSPWGDYHKILTRSIRRTHNTVCAASCRLWTIDCSATSSSWDAGDFEISFGGFGNLNSCIGGCLHGLSHCNSNSLMNLFGFAIFVTGDMRTSFLAGSTFNVTWHLAYPHRVSKRIPRSNDQSNKWWWKSQDHFRKLVWSIDLLFFLPNL